MFSRIIGRSPCSLVYRGFAQYKNMQHMRSAAAATKPKSKADQVVKNEGIRFPEVRVIYDDEITGKPSWKVLARADAMKWAKSKSLDLILVNSKANPPVCKLDSYKEVVHDIRKKEHDSKQQQQTDKKKKSIKTILIGALIDTHDLGVKIRKVREFIEDGIQVKLTIFIKKPSMRKNPLAMDETTIKVLDLIEEFVGQVQPVSRIPTKVDFILSPKKSTASTAADGAAVP